MQCIIKFVVQWLAITRHLIVSNEFLTVESEKAGAKERAEIRWKRENIYDCTLFSNNPPWLVS